MTKRRNRRAFSAEFKAKAVGLCRTSGRSIAQVAKDLDLTETALRRWVSQTEVDDGRGTLGAPSSSEKEELSRLRRENKVLRQERDILKAAATFFAKENE